MYRIIVYLFIASLILFSCSKSDPGPVINNKIPPFLRGKGIYLLNEGNFTHGNGSLSFYSYDSAKLYNHVFLQINERPLGDVPNSINIFNNKAYIIVNNSGTVEITDRESLQSVKTVTGLVSPRNMAFVNNTKAYITSLYSKSVTILDLNQMSVSGSINIGRTSESISIINEKAIISNWMSGKMIFVVNTLTDMLIDSIEVAREPESMIIDKNKTIWVLCNGGYTRENFAELISIEPLTLKIVKRLTFPAKTDSPLCLQVDGAGETLYYLDKGVRKMNINDAALPSTAFISESSHLFYKLFVNPYNGDIFLTDAVDYQDKGYLMHYNKEGALLDTFEAGTIPGNMCFKQ
jgi:hypothetical protein